MDYVVLNVSGTIFRLHKKTFCRLPSHCFENCVSNQQKMDEKDSCEEYYLERHAESFTAIVWFYTNGELHMPSSVCPSVFCRELKFWQIDDRKMSRCCYMKYVSFFEDQALLKTFELEETKAGRSGNILRPSNSKWEYTRRKVWRVLDDPMSSTLAKIYVASSAIVILMSIFVLVASTHPDFQRKLDCEEIREFLGDGTHMPKSHQHCEKELNEKPEIVTSNVRTVNANTTNNTNSSMFDNNNETEGYTDDIIDTHTRFDYLTIMDYFTVGFFLVELVIRYIFCPDKKIFFCSFLNIVDIIALTSECIINFIEYLFPKEKYAIYSSLDFIECIQIARVFRLFRLVRNFIGFRVFIYSVRASFKNMVLMVFLMFVAALIFSAVVFYSDRDAFKSIPDAIWWSVVTMTTVGYGDAVPKSLLGKMIGCVCAVTGVFVLAVLIPVLVSNFVLFIGFARIPLRNQGNDLATMVKQEFVLRKDRTEIQLLSKKTRPKVYNSSGSP
ncbi:unnamed protein product [Mytilus edulis]|uniref:BTB domain-containing protein n=1 Tax=Mytilus edulis TaxID=6550 RepID=A0A8S3TSM5_MYTED|nr:unnamed protein product [Mytilus edulis]